jgi:WD40 repeat protein
MSGITNVNIKTTSLNIGTSGTGVSTKQFDKNEFVQKITMSNDNSFMNYSYIHPLPHHSIDPGSAWDINYSLDCNFLAAAVSTTPFVKIYARNGGRYEKLPNPSALPTDWAFGVSFSPNGTYLAVSHQTSRFLTIYKRSGNTFTKLADPSTLPAQVSRRGAWSPDSVYLAVPHTWSPYLTIYKRSGDTFTKLANPSVLPTGNAYGAAFSSDGVYLSIAHDASPFVTIYKRSGDTFTKLANPSILPGGNGRNVAIDPTNTYMAVANISTTDNLKIYKRSGDVFTALATQPTQATNNGKSVSFSPDSNYLVFGTRMLPYIRFFKRSGDSFSVIPQAAGISTIAYGVHYNSEGRAGVAVSSTNGHLLVEYENINDTMRNSTNLNSVLVRGSAYPSRMAVSRKGLFLAAANDTVSPRICVARKKENWYEHLQEINDIPGTIRDILFSDDAKYLFVARSSTYLNPVLLYERNETTDLYEPSSKLPNFSGSQSSRGVALHPNKKYIAISHFGAPRISIYDITTNPFTQITSSFTAPASVNGTPAFSSCGNYLVSTSATAPFLRLYGFNKGVLTDVVQPSIMPTAAPMDCWFSPDNNFFVASLGVSPRIVLYSFSSGILTHIGQPGGDPLTSNVRSLCFSLDSSQFYVGASAAAVATYQLQSGAYTRIVTPITNNRTYGTDGDNTIFGSSDGFYLVRLGWASEGYMLLYPTGPTVGLLSPVYRKKDIGIDSRFPVEEIGYVQQNTNYAQSTNFKSLAAWQV